MRRNQGGQFVGVCGRMELLFGAVVLMVLGVKNAAGLHATTLCVQVGQANFNQDIQLGFPGYNDYDLKLNSKDSYHTIGTYKFRTTHWFLDVSFGGAETPVTGMYSNLTYYSSNKQDCPYSSGPKQLVFLDACPTDDMVEIRTFAVRQNGVIMKGWLHFEIELMDKDDEIYGIYVQVRDEFFNAIGEFVSKPEEQCNSANPDLVMPTPFQILPCSAVGYREAEVSDALYMVHPIMLDNQTAGMPYLPTKNISRGIHFTWKLSEYWCNRHYRFRPEAVVFTKKMYTHNSPRTGDPKVYRKAANYWLFPGWYRSADIKLDATTLTCDEKVIDYTIRGSVGSSVEVEMNGKEPVATWILKDAARSLLANDYFAFEQQYMAPRDDGSGKIDTNFRSCQANPRGRNEASFSGRCTHHYEKTPSHDALQGCNLDDTAPEFDQLKGLQTYGDYLHILTINRTRLCSDPCRPPANLTDLIAIQMYNSSTAPIKKPQVMKFTNIGATRNQSKVQKFWAGRKFHGQVLTFWTMFLIPVGTFASRYLKETAMSNACIGFHMWFWIHLATLVLGSGLLGCGFLALYDLIKTFGRSLNEFSGFHRILSICSMVLFGFMLLLGGFRSINMKLRKVLLFLHSFIGFLIYFLNLSAMILSTWIPASPSMAGDCDPDGRPIGLSNVALVTMAWLVVDIITHVGMTILQVLVDRKYNVIRNGFYCPIVPFLPPESINDLKGKHFRKIIFLVYMLVAFFFALTVIFMLSGDQVPKKCMNNTGPSTCEDPWGCSNWAQAYSHRYPRGPTEAPQAAN